jgi:hypothetical protein
MAVIWIVMPSILVEVYQVSDVFTASIISIIALQYFLLQHKNGGISFHTLSYFSIKNQF